MSCAPYTQIPAPPTTLSSCAVPIGGSNSSILDACCNGHINAITTYSAPDADTNSEDNDGCFQFCVTDSPDMVRGCLTQKTEVYEKDSGAQMFECFNVGRVKKSSGGGYDSAGGISRGGISWAMGMLLSIGLVGAVVGAV